MKVFVVIQEDCYDCQTETTVAKIFTTKSKAEDFISYKAKTYLDQYKNDYGAEEVVEDTDDLDEDSGPRILFNQSKGDFTIWENGCYCENHASVYIIEKEVED